MIDICINLERSLSYNELRFSFNTFSYLIPDTGYYFYLNKWLCASPDAEAEVFAPISKKDGVLPLRTWL
jgi:hypothetical protein